MSKSSSTPARKFIIAVSILIPVVVALLYMLPKPDSISEETLRIIHQLPRMNAIINGTTFFILLGAWVAIKRKNILLHRRLMTTALVLSALFLLSYVTYHSLTEDTRFGGEGAIRTVYFFILISHILLSAIIVPLVLVSYVRALSQKFDKHRKIARITLPVWLYVAMTGVLVYLLISPYYPFNL